MKKASVMMLVAAFGPHSASAATVTAVATANPIRKVVTLLQAMQKKVTEEGEAEERLYDSFMCYCKTGTSDLSESIAASQAKGPQVGAQIEATEEKLTQAKATLSGAQEDREAAKTAMSEASALREKEAAAYAALESDQSETLASIDKAVAALEKGAFGSFLQSGAASSLRKVLDSGKVPLEEADRQDLTAFLSQSTSSDYAPQSGEVIGILKQMKEEMSKELAEATATEEAAIKTFEELMAAKKKEIASLSETVETKTAQIGELGVSVVQMKEELSDSEEALLEDQKFLEELKEGCEGKTAEYEERKKTRAEELMALADTIKVLNDDDALELFKKAIPTGTSLLQVQRSVEAQRQSALSIVTQLKSPSSQQPALDLISLALTSKRSSSGAGFEKVIKMIDEMVVMLGKEQEDDEKKGEYCTAQFDSSDDKKKALERSIEDEESAIEDAKEGIETLAEEIAALTAGIKALDKSVAEATEQRKAENAEYKELMASDAAAKQLLDFAKNRLNQFYNPKLYKPPAEQELSEEDKIFVSNGGTPPPTEAPGGIAGTGIAALVQITAHRQLSREAPAAPPATWGAYTKKSEDSNGVMAMMDLLIKDLEKEMTEAEAEEKNAQKSYEELMSDSAAKRAEDSKFLTSKSATKADLEENLEARMMSKKDAVSELMATEKYIASLHAECDWLLKYAEARKSARTSEIDSLKRAKAVLAGADYSLLQVEEAATSWSADSEPSNPSSTSRTERSGAALQLQWLIVCSP
eukprot:CAMPEP_0206444848 /NCGR_PEP_ID=MMETSP0324_2-20121206/15148_1 /ASSEMBLY_ACC=CAM_ASM_000836 /TAXON_ID=2866 /ORGANISM="Crypthecodinium cohnii, Strain Seligo" /LENGTH=756 /DNA_ID=CAMNT_0053912933 /DNA_START=232 /DNA_END=2500 /DNA_ORIENTATION=+